MLLHVLNIDCNSPACPSSAQSADNPLVGLPRVLRTPTQSYTDPAFCVHGALDHGRICCVHTNMQVLNWAKLFPTAEPRALDLLTKLLCADLQDRITAEQALAHPCFEGMHHPQREPSAPGAHWHASLELASTICTQAWVLYSPG